MVRVLLDEHLSGPVIGKALAGEGHDVRDVGSDSMLAGAADDYLFEVAAAEQRLMVTANVRDFIPLASRYGSGGQDHAGLILIPASIRNEDFAALVGGLRNLLEGTSQQEWVNRVHWLSKRKQ